MRLTEWAEDARLIHPNQSGFRKNRSTQDNIFKIIESCKAGLMLKKNAAIILFDIEKAFDKAPHYGILRQLDLYGCPPILGKWLSSFLSDRSFIVEIDGVFSLEESITAGVPQGSHLSPLLFSLFINEIGSILDKLDVHFALFADDLTIWKIHSEIDSIEQTLQLATNAINLIFTNIGLKLNEKKCQYSIFTSKRSHLSINIFINNKLIDYVTNPVILGISFDKKINFVFHFRQLLKKIISKINLLSILSRKSNNLEPRYLLTIYKALILSKVQ